MEKMGIPSVSDHAPGLHGTRELDRGKRRHAAPARTVFTPHPVGGKTPDELVGVRKGPDPVTGKPMMKEIVDDLTVPLSADEKKTGMQCQSGGTRAIYGPDSLDNLQAIFLNNGMTDYMPIIIPTEEKVAAMLKGTSHSRMNSSDAIQDGGYTSARWTYTVKQVAVNAVMAGCEAANLSRSAGDCVDGRPCARRFDDFVRLLDVINGPIRDKLNMNYGIGALSPFAQSNATIGRAWTLMGKNLGNGGFPATPTGAGRATTLNYNNA